MTAGRGRVVAALVIVAVLLGGGGYLVGRMTAPTLAAPTSESAAAGFLRDMQVHHAQAVEMAMIVRDATDDPEIRLLAYDIALTQAHQQGQMYGLLEAWDLPQSSPAAPMAWLVQPTIDGSGGQHSHGAGDGGMPGMATPVQLAELSGLRGVDAERLFLELMITHHEAGVEMAEAVLARSAIPQIVSLATGMSRAQLSEITAMEDLLAARS